MQSVQHTAVWPLKAAADRWFAENDPEGVAFEYEVNGEQPGWLARWLKRKARRVFDRSDVTYPLLAITLAARRNNLRNTLAVF